MKHGLNRRIGGGLLLIALAAVLVSGGILAACSKGQTSTTASTTTTTSTSTRTTTSAPATTTTSAPATTTTSATTPKPTGVSAADFYKDNLVTLVVPYAAGAGTDYSARVFATHWNAVTGGRAVVDNRIGGGGSIGSNYVYLSKPDGLIIGVGIPGSGLISPTLAKDPAVRWDLNKMNWIEYVNPETYAVGMSVRLPYKSWDEVVKVKGLKFASDARYSNYSLAAGLMIEFFGLQDARIVLGYAGATEAQLAVGKGECDAFAGTNPGLQDGIVKNLNKAPLIQVNTQRSAYFPDSPAMTELLTLSTEQQNLLTTFMALVSGQVYWLPPGTPQDRIDFVRAAFDKIVTLDGWKKDIMMRWPFQVPPVSGKDYTATMQKTLAVATPERYTALQANSDKYGR